MCPTTTWFGKLTLFTGLILIFTVKDSLWNNIGYLLMIVSFIYSAFFTDKSCGVDYDQEKKEEGSSDN